MARDDESILSIAKRHGKPHKLFLNLVRQLRAIRVCKVIKVFERILNACSIGFHTHSELKTKLLANAIIKTINAKLDGKVTAKLETVTDERYPDEEYIVFVWPAVHRQSFTSLKLISAEESKIFFQWIAHMFNDTNLQRGEIASIDALNIGVESSDIKYNQSQHLLQKLVKDAIFTFSEERTTYSLHPKGIAEFYNVLSDPSYGITSCPVCLKLVVLQRASTKCTVCNTNVHNMCIHKMVKKVKDRDVPCPGVIKTGGHCTMKFDKTFASTLYFDEPPMFDRQRPVVIESTTDAS